MATEILPATTQLATQYKLPDRDRQAIRSQAPSARAAAAIKHQRRQFVDTYGCPFGLEQTDNRDLLQQKKRDW